MAKGKVSVSVTRMGSHVCQCFSTALVESMMVPSMSNRKPWKVARTGGAENPIVLCNYSKRDV